MSIFEISTQLRRSLTNTLKRGSSPSMAFLLEFMTTDHHR